VRHVSLNPGENLASFVIEERSVPATQFAARARLSWGKLALTAGLPRTLLIGVET
jgi:hypothetical protein